MFIYSLIAKFNNNTSLLDLKIVDMEEVFLPVINCDASITSYSSISYKETRDILNSGIKVKFPVKERDIPIELLREKVTEFLNEKLEIVINYRLVYSILELNSFKKPKFGSRAYLSGLGVPYNVYGSTYTSPCTFGVKNILDKKREVKITETKIARNEKDLEIVKDKLLYFLEDEVCSILDSTDISGIRGISHMLDSRVYMFINKLRIKKIL